MARLKKYRIKRGKHSSGLRIAPFYGKDISKYEVIFSKSCLYEIAGPDQFDVNKLLGLSYGFHHNNSARFGWRADGDSIEISAYCYKNKKRLIRAIRNVNVETMYIFMIQNFGGYYELTIMSDTGDLIGYAKISKPKTTEFGYKLFPYFGGNVPAPHDMEIYMKKIQ
jgi:hypothetical protein